MAKAKRDDRAGGEHLVDGGEGAAAAVQGLDPLDVPAGDAPDPLGPAEAQGEGAPPQTATDPDPGMTAPPVVPVPIPPPMPPPLPPFAALGWLVVYLMPNGGAQPAIVTRAYAEGAVDLVALHAPQHSAYGGPPQCTTFRGQVKPGEEPGCWRPLPSFEVGEIRALEAP